MTAARVIPVLQIFRDEAIKTIQFASSQYIGDPINSVRLFSELCADELVVMDIGAANGKYPIQLKLLSSLTSEAFMPFGYGGGVRSLYHAVKLFELGIEKVLIRWRGNETARLVEEISNLWGNQAVSVVIDYVDRKKLMPRSPLAYSRQQVVGLVKRIQDAGAGEIVIQSVDRDGTMLGFDLDLIRDVKSESRVQLVALGGAGTRQDVSQAIHAGATGVAAGSLFVFRDVNKAVLINYPTEIELKSLISLQGLEL
jgi:cyclase